MFPKNRRIPRKMFPLLQNGAKTFKNKLFLLRFVSIKKESPPASGARALRAGRFCFSISKKVSKKAVIRNKLRRAGYRTLKEHLFKIKPEILAIFSFKEVAKNNKEIEKNLESILKESNLIK
jgi:ribonuclease P protein component